MHLYWKHFSDIAMKTEVKINTLLPSTLGQSTTSTRVMQIHGRWCFITSF